MPSVTGVDDGSGYGVKGESPTGSGVIGTGDSWAGVVASSVTGSGVSTFSDSGAGVLSASNSGAGVSAESVSATGVAGKSTSGAGVSGESVSGVGVIGSSAEDNGMLGATGAGGFAGALGRNTAEQGGNGLVGIAEGLAGVGVFGQAEHRGVGVVGNGSSGVLGQGGPGPGVRGTSEHNHGVVGTANGERAAGVAGTGRTGPGVIGTGGGGPGVSGTTGLIREPGVRGENTGQGTGVLGLSGGTNTQLPTVAAVQGVSSGSAPGVQGRSTGGIGVVGIGRGSNFAAGWGFPGAGVVGAGTTADPGVYGYGAPGVVGLGTGDMPGVSAIGGLGALGTSTMPAGGFVGDVVIAGGLKVAGGAKLFMIDHPLDPERRFLQHAAVESAQLKTFYDGTVTLDDSGTARVELPDWFATLNADPCYSLTAVGGPAPDLHIADEFDGRGFTIAGGRPRGRVCWQITGVRHDPSATAHPLIVEHDKPEHEIGRFADPIAYGRPPSEQLTWAADLLAQQAELDRLPHQDTE